jgi:hypothetical protein
MASTVSTNDRVFAWVLRAGAAALTAYWADFFSRGDVRTSDEQAYVDFEKAFLLADAFLVGAALSSAHYLSRGRPEAVPTGIAAGSSLTFLGLMDLAYDLQQRKFASRSAATAVEASIVATSLTLGPYTMIRMWQARHRLSAS